MIKSILLLSFAFMLFTMTQGACPPCRSQKVAVRYLFTSSYTIGTFDPTTGVFARLLQLYLVDEIAVSSTNQIYGTTGTSLHTINSNDGSLELKGDHGRYLYNIAFGPDDVLYGVDPNGFFCKIDTTTGVATQISTINGLGWARALVYDPISQQFFLASDGADLFVGYKLFSIQLDGSNSLIGEGTDWTAIQGLFLDGESLYGVTQEHKQVLFDRTNGQVTLVKDVTGTTDQIYGSTQASTCENPSSKVLKSRASQAATQALRLANAVNSEFDFQEFMKANPTTPINPAFEL